METGREDWMAILHEDARPFMSVPPYFGAFMTDLRVFSSSLRGVGVWAISFC